MRGVAVHLLSDKGKLPISMQVRALKDFRKGELVLAPVGGTLLADDHIEAVTPIAAKALHDAMLQRVSATVRAGTIDGRRRDVDRSPTTEQGFVITSPLLEAKQQKNRESCMENLAPFWAVCRCGAPRALHNMELESFVFVDTGLANVAGAYPKMPKAAKFSLEMTILRNTKRIAEGDILCLPFE